METMAAPPGLLEKVMEKIHAARLRQMRVRLMTAMFGVFASIAYAVSRWPAMWLELQQSSFAGLLRLAISDSDIAMANAKELGLGLLESVPFDAIIVALVCAFAVLLAAAFLSSMRHERHSPFLPHSV